MVCLGGTVPGESNFSENERAAHAVVTDSLSSCAEDNLGTRSHSGRSGDVHHPHTGTYVFVRTRVRIRLRFNL